jgi:flagellar hook-associated protein 1 FlgK
MSLAQALSSALSGLRVSQSGLGLVATNVANADSPGYTRKAQIQGATIGGQTITGVRVERVQRELDLFVQRQMRVEVSGGGFADMMSRFHNRLDLMFGTPGGANALDTQVARFAEAAQALATSPDSALARGDMVARGDVLAQHLRAMSTGIQDLRAEAEAMIGESVSRLNDLFNRVADLNGRIAQTTDTSSADAALLDQRDVALEEISALIDVRVTIDERGGAQVSTATGVQLVGQQAARLAFDARQPLSPVSRWSVDPDQRGVGTIVVASGRPPVDLIAARSIRSGELAALLDMRDTTLVEAQSQLDELAVALARAFSDRDVAGTPVTSGPGQGYQLGPALQDIQAGDTIRLVTDGPGGPRTISFVGVDDAALLPLPDTFTPESGDTVVGFDMSAFGSLTGEQRVAAIAAAINAVPGIGISASVAGSGPAAGLQVIGGGALPRTVVSAGARLTAVETQGQGLSLPFFVDGSEQARFTGAPQANGSQAVGFAARIAVNGEVRRDPGLLTLHGPGVEPGDPARANHILTRLTQTTRTFAPTEGGGDRLPFQGTIGGFVRHVVSQRGIAAESAGRIAEGQRVVVDNLRARFEESAGVNVDAEMSRLIALQTAYGANARVMTTIKEILDTLMRM